MVQQAVVWLVCAAIFVHRAVALSLRTGTKAIFGLFEAGTKALFPGNDPGPLVGGLLREAFALPVAHLSHATITSFGTATIGAVALIARISEVNRATQ